MMAMLEGVIAQGAPSTSGAHRELAPSVTGNGVLPPAVLKALSSAMRGGKRRKSKTKKRKRFIRA